MRKVILMLDDINLDLVEAPIAEQLIELFKEQDLYTAEIEEDFIWIDDLWIDKDAIK